jgi:hypothetical protein
MVLIKYLTHFVSLILMGIKIMDKKKTPLRTRPFLSLMIHLTDFEPMAYLEFVVPFMVSYLTPYNTKSPIE